MSGPASGDPLSEVSPTVATAHRREYLWAGQLRFIFDRLHPTSSGLTAWVEVRWVGALAGPTVLGYGRYDLMSSRTVPGLARQVETNLGKSHADIPVSQILTGVCYDVVRDHLEGVPTVRLSDVATPGNSWILKPLIGGDQATSFLGPGGVGKSFVALAAALTVCTGRTGFLGMKPQVTGPVMYLDWEATEAVQAGRMRALCDPLRIPVPDTLLYRQPKGPLWQYADEIATAIAAGGVRLAVVDSVMLARGGDAFSPESTIMLFSALHELAVPCLLVDHKSREAMRKGWKGAFGSVVNDNSTRLMWEFLASVDLPDDRQQFRVVQSKRNNDRRRESLAFELAFTNDKADRLTGVKITPINPVNVIAMTAAENAPLAEQVEVALRRSGNLGMTVRELEEAVGKGAHQIRSRLAELVKRSDGEIFKRVDRWFAKGMDDQQRTGTDEYPDPW